MTTLPAHDAHAGLQKHWQGEYTRHLQQRLARSLDYLNQSPRAEVRAHLRSFLALLNETRRYPHLTQEALRLITRLHPLPVRWGLGYLWESELRFALEHTPPAQADARAEYQCDLGDVHLFSGQFEKAIRQAEAALASPSPPPTLAARAVRILFTCLRSTGDPNQADEWIERTRARFMGDQPAREVPPGLAQAWLRFNQCQLELLREQGKIDSALELVEQMIWLDRREGARDSILTADLLTHRSTLLWVRARYHESVADLQAAVDLYRREDDLFNAESLNSNLGLVYWTMGELDHAEASLRAAIRYYRKTGSQQLLTYDIGNLGLVHFARGQLEEALRQTQEHIQHALKINFISEYNRGRRNLGTILIYFGRIPEAIRELDACHAYYEKRGSRDGYALDVVWLARCEYLLGDPEKARQMAAEVLEESIQRGSVVLEQVTLRCLADFLPPGDQEAPLLRSLELARANNRRLEEAATLLALAAASTQADQGLKLWEAGARLLVEMGAESWLEGRSPQNPPFIPLLL